VRQRLVAEADVRAMLRLVARASVAPGGYEAKRRCLLDGLADLVSADSWIWTVAHSPSSTRHEILEQARGGTCNPQGIPRGGELVRWNISSLSAAPGLGPCSSDRSPVTPLRRTRGSRGGTGAQSKAPPVRNIVFRHQLSSTSYAIVVFERTGSNAAPTDRELSIVRLALEEYPWLEQSQPAVESDGGAARLPLRQRETLNLLVEGRSRKEIADELGISIHTVGDYTKALYKHFKVQSQAQLISLFIRSNPGAPSQHAPVPRAA
jgi:DNA-binding CsgD family transcriptional regulator